MKVQRLMYLSIKLLKNFGFELREFLNDSILLESNKFSKGSTPLSQVGSIFEARCNPNFDDLYFLERFS